MQGGVLDSDAQGASWLLAGATLEGVQLIGIDELQVVGHSTFDNCQVDGTVRVVNGNATIRNGLELNGEWILNPNSSVNFVRHADFDRDR